jgi:hypothetical protein
MRKKMRVQSLGAISLTHFLKGGRMYISVIRKHFFKEKEGYKRVKYNSLLLYYRCVKHYVACVLSTTRSYAVIQQQCVRV